MDLSFSGAPFLEVFYLLNLLQRAISPVLENSVDLEAAVVNLINISYIVSKLMVILMVVLFGFGEQMVLSATGVSRPPWRRAEARMYVLLYGYHVGNSYRVSRCKSPVASELLETT